MTLGTARPRNWGKESQEAALAIVMRQRRVAYEVRCDRLFLAPSHNGVTLPFVESFATLVHVRRGRWEAQHPFDGRVLATGVSERDVIRATIQTIWH